MSHHFESRSGFHFNFDDDLEGLVSLTSPTGGTFEVDAESLVEAVILCRVVPRQVARLESSSYEDVLQDIIKAG